MVKDKTILDKVNGDDGKEGPKGAVAHGAGTIDSPDFDGYPANGEIDRPRKKAFTWRECAKKMMKRLFHSTSFFAPSIVSAHGSRGRLRP
jgi:hypothetical protein